MLKLVTVETGACMMCGNPGSVVVDLEGYLRWQEGGTLIQEALPDLDNAQRELLITGTHENCWLDLTKDEDDG